jgi:hypothetical protein
VIRNTGTRPTIGSPTSLEAAADQAIAAFDGDAREAVKADRRQRLSRNRSGKTAGCDLDGLWREGRCCRVIGRIGIIEGSGARLKHRVLVASERQLSRFADIRENVSQRAHCQVQFMWRHTVVQKQQL